MHVLRDCTRNQRNMFYAQKLREWFNTKLLARDKRWSTKFDTICWTLWNWRKNRVLNDDGIEVQAAVRLVNQRVDEMERSQKKLSWQAAEQSRRTEIGWVLQPGLKLILMERGGWWFIAGY
ncbi:OLC1v1006640C1 [Oldenlandia corymbosa var. corymbosa]|uniref:OLC1v1006640C1 n=1 Tax=Oldenlandia corymbosa var. corymbosa TaxID=529605 RepID=A0AAV1DHK5_OLDCO|nr:OLC1v1006640C1 [Oldenlandia corymbosa var. corymbosa]